MYENIPEQMSRGQKKLIIPILLLIVMIGFAVTGVIWHRNQTVLYVVPAVVIAAGTGMLAYFFWWGQQQETLIESEKEKLRHALEYDSLTGILVEKVFQEQVKKRIEDGLTGEHCLIYLDVYKFKLVNEMFGHEKGDELLTVIARELKQIADRNNGLCARIGGDKFVLFTPYRPEIINLFYIRKEQNPRVLPIEVYLHYGIYVIRRTDIPVSTMIDCAQLAQQSVKGNYDNYVSFYNDEIKKKIIREQEIINSMAKALADGEFVIYLQPQYSYKDGTIHGSEALVRWENPTKGIISPGEFIPLFERNGFIIKLDENIWEQACKLLRAWIDQGLNPLPISINVSRADLLRGSVAQKLTSLIEKYKLTSDLLRVEITESAYMDNPQQLIMEINELRNHGFMVEMDDFGSGYSSLNMLKDLPINVLKTDLKFLDATGFEDRKNQILDSVIHMAHQIGLEVVAEGVETKEQADYLMKLECEIMQGYYFARPIPVHEFEKLAYGKQINGGK